MSAKTQSKIAKSRVPDHIKRWLQTHHEWFEDPKQKSRLYDFDHIVVDDGHKRFSPGYIKAMEAHMNGPGSTFRHRGSIYYGYPKGHPQKGHPHAGRKLMTYAQLMKHWTRP